MPSSPCYNGCPVFDGDLLRQRRLNAGISQADLGARLSSKLPRKISRQDVWGWEHGHHVPAGNTLAVIAWTIGCRIDDMFRSGASR